MLLHHTLQKSHFFLILIIFHNMFFFLQYSTFISHCINKCCIRRSSSPSLSRDVFRKGSFAKQDFYVSILNHFIVLGDMKYLKPLHKVYSTLFITVYRKRLCNICRVSRGVGIRHWKKNIHLLAKAMRCWEKTLDLLWKKALAVLCFFFFFYCLKKCFVSEQHWVFYIFNTSLFCCKLRYSLLLFF